MLSFPFPRPEPGALNRVADGLLWLRLALPFTLDHINVYLIEDSDGWIVYDTGIGDEATMEVWEDVVRERLGGKPLKRVIVSHYHPDHIGLAGWLGERFGVPLLTTQTTYLQCLSISLSPGALDAPVYRDFSTAIR